jgi:hypothetical protein
MSEDTGEGAALQFLCEQLASFLRKRFAGPLHVIFDKDLDRLTVDASTTLQSGPNTAAGGHVGSEFHP